MENKKSPSKKKLISIQEEKFIREVDYDSLAEARPHKKLLLEILQKVSPFKHSPQKILVSIKPKAPSIKTLYIAEKSRFHSKKHSNRSGSRLAIGDHSSFTTRIKEDDSNTVTTCGCETTIFENQPNSEIIAEKSPLSTLQIESSRVLSKCSNTETTSQTTTICNTQQRSIEKCYIYTQPEITMIHSKPNKNTEKHKNKSKKARIGTFVVENTSSDDILPSTPQNILNLKRRIYQLEKKILKQEMVFRAIDPNISLSSSDEETENNMRPGTSKGKPGCSYVEYSHIPETSAFQRYTQQPAPLSASKATTIQKEHNSEQYGRDFTLYDGITARGRRQCASVPCKRDDGSKMAAERVHKIRHKLNPVRDYRLMDTVHYLAQGEFAPRDDGIKLTPSREAVLSDIIYEDVCRTHWPNARLSRRVAHPERYGTRSELQRLIDSLLRERVAHVERRKRRHYRIVKLNHRHENCRPVGKTGDIIVASHKNRQGNDDRDIVVSDHNTGSALTVERRHPDRSYRKAHRSHDRLIIPEPRQNRHFRQDDCSPGPSYDARHVTANREPTCCYHTSSPTKPPYTRSSVPDGSLEKVMNPKEITSGSTIVTGKIHPKNPRIVVKKNSSRKKYSREEPNLEHYILLPTLVVKTPSNMRRQKKFNELYHRVLNVQLHKNQNHVNNKIRRQNPESVVSKKDIGININVTLSNSEENFIRK